MYVVVINMVIIACKFQFASDVSNCSFVQFQIWDLPGSDHVNIFDTANFDTESIIMGCAAIVFVIDAQVGIRVTSWTGFFFLLDLEVNNDVKLLLVYELG